MNAGVEKGVALRRNVQIDLQVNGEPTEVSFAPYKTLLELLREDLGLPGTKHGCELGECGACAVLLDGEPVLSCLVLALECAGRAVETIEGLAGGTGLHPLQAAFTDLGGSQCGYCTPGMVMTAKALLDKEPNPSREQIREAIAGNICRCTGYQQIVDAIEAAAGELRAAGESAA
jgi:carbon-monoxide dehydrogenase small subunit